MGVAVSPAAPPLAVHLICWSEPEGQASPPLGAWIETRGLGLVMVKFAAEAVVPET